MCVGCSQSSDAQSSPIALAVQVQPKVKSGEEAKADAAQLLADAIGAEKDLAKKAAEAHIRAVLSAKDDHTKEAKAAIEAHAASIVKRVQVTAFTTRTHFNFLFRASIAANDCMRWFNPSRVPS